MGQVLDRFIDDLANLAEYAIETAEGSSDDEDFLILKSFAQKVVGFRNNIIKDFPIVEKQKMMLCQCGESNNYPFCDGTHSKL